MVIYLAHGETFRKQQIIIEAKASGVLLSYKVLSRKSDEYVHKLLSGYQNHTAIMVEPEDCQPDEYLKWVSRRCSYNDLVFLEPRLPKDEINEFRKRVYQQALPLVPIWKPDQHNSKNSEDFENLCRKYSFVAIEGVTKKQELMELLRIAYSYKTRLHAHSVTKHGVIAKPTILKNLPLASAASVNWDNASRFHYVYRFSPAKRELSYKQYTASTNIADMDKLSANAWAQYSAYLDVTQWQYWLEEEQQRLKGNRYTGAIERYIQDNNYKTALNNTRHARRLTTHPELNADLAERSRGVGETFKINQGAIQRILKNNGYIENKRRRAQADWLWDQRSKAAIFKTYLHWAGPSDFNKRWLEHVEENRLTSENDIAEAGQRLYNEESANTLTQGLIQAIRECKASLCGKRPVFNELDDRAVKLVEFIFSGEHLPRTPWIRKSKNRPSYSR